MTDTRNEIEEVPHEQSLRLAEIMLRDSLGEVWNGAVRAAFWLRERRRLRRVVKREKREALTR